MSSGLPITLLTVLVVLLVIQRWLERKRLPAGVRPLPGPTNLPFIGRVHDVPEKGSWLKFYEWSKVYGPIYQTKMFGVTHVWISSEKIAHDLLSRRANIYSDRPLIPNLPDNRTSGDYLALLGRNDIWKRQRKLCNHLMHASALASLHDYPTLERNRFLYLLSQSPKNYIEYIEQFTSRTVSRLSWGSAHPAQILRHTTFGLLETISPSGALPNVISFLRHLPLTLSPWRQKEKARHDLEDKQFRSNIGFVRRMMDLGRAEPSFIRTFLEEQQQQQGGSTKGASAGEEEEEEKKMKEADEAMHVVGLMAIAGALTIGSPIQTYILAMCHYPEWQARLQEEIDVKLAGRCPMWEDREQLPLLRAVVKEVIRWRPPVPTGIPHAIEKDDVYEGYFIPAGATIHALEWAITRDETTYPDAETFNPSRFLLPSFPQTYREPLTTYPNLSGFSQFGFGRRTCQGVPIVEQDLFLTMGGMAWALTITKKTDPVTGQPLPVHWNDYTPLLIAKPCRFPFDAVPRDKHKVRKMKEMHDEAVEREECEKEESREERERTERWMVEGGVRQKEEEIPWQTVASSASAGADAAGVDVAAAGAVEAHGVVSVATDAPVAPGVSVVSVAPVVNVDVTPVVNVNVDVVVPGLGDDGYTSSHGHGHGHAHVHQGHHQAQHQQHQAQDHQAQGHQTQDQDQHRPQHQVTQDGPQEEAKLMAEHDVEHASESQTKTTTSSRTSSPASTRRSMTTSLTGSLTGSGSASGSPSWGGSEPSLSFRSSSAESSDCDCCCCCEEVDRDHQQEQGQARGKAEGEQAEGERRRRTRMVRIKAVSNASSTCTTGGFESLVPTVPTTPEREEKRLRLGVGVGVGEDLGEEVPGAWRW